MYPPAAPWSGVGQLESEISRLKSDLNNKANNHDITSMLRRIERLEDNLDSLRQDIEVLRQAVNDALYMPTQS